jgi:predicted PurR-regulated permease PerM
MEHWALTRDSADRPKLNLLAFASAAALTVLVAYLMVVGQPILLPFVIAVFVWYLINALSALSGRISIRGHPLPGRLRFGLAIGALLLLSWLVVQLIIDNVSYVMAAGPVYEQNLLRLANRGGSWFGYEELEDVRVLFGGLNVNALLRSLTLGLTGMLGSVGTVAIYTVFLLLEQHHFDTKITALFPDPQREALVRRILDRIGAEIQTYVWLKTLISAGTALACYAVMKTAGLDLAEFWALVIFALNFIPYIGGAARARPVRVVHIHFDDRCRTDAHPIHRRQHHRATAHGHRPQRQSRVHAAVAGALGRHVGRRRHVPGSTDHGGDHDRLLAHQRHPPDCHLDVG